MLSSYRSFKENSFLFLSRIVRLHKIFFESSESQGIRVAYLRGMLTVYTPLYVYTSKGVSLFSVLS
jgi:hypothetical protein